LTPEENTEMVSQKLTHVNPVVTAIMAEQQDWLNVLSKPGETVLRVYLDLKSPHAYLAVRPSLEVARDFKVTVDFHTYTLSYENLGLTTRVDNDMKRRPPSQAADRKARMYYAAAREYAALQALPLRSPVRLLDSRLANRAFNYAKTQHLEVPFAMWVYLQGWGSGWREFELESAEALRGACAEVGVDTSSFDDYIDDKNEGSLAVEDSMIAANESGFAGVPHYSFTDPASGRISGLFGREHLALIRTKFMHAGLARHANVNPEFSHAWKPTPRT
jgi:2-hydroxychromene-2-carboxylate isomerase